jgi:hypothetical protein
MPSNISDHLTISVPSCRPFPRAYQELRQFLIASGRMPEALHMAFKGTLVTQGMALGFGAPTTQSQPPTGAFQMLKGDLITVDGPI